MSASYGSERERHEAIYQGVITKLVPHRRADLAGASPEVLEARLVREALEEHYDRIADRNYARDDVERIVSRAVSDAMKRGPQA